MINGQTQNLHDIIECCYSAIDTPAQLAVATDMIGKAIGADAGDIVSEFSGGGTRTYGSFGFEPTFLKQYDSEYLGQNPWLDNLLQFESMCAHSDDKFSEEYRSSRYYNEWVRPQGLSKAVGAVVEHTPGKTSTWAGFVREIGAPGFAETECTFLSKVMPHLRRTLDVLGAFDEMSAQQSSMQAMCDVLNVPIILLDANGVLTFKNEMASGLLSQNAGIFLSSNGQLSARDAKTNEALAASIKATIDFMDTLDNPSPNTIPVEVGNGKFIALTVVPLSIMQQFRGTEARVAVFASGAEIAKNIDITPVSQIYGLTNTESKLARSIGTGENLARFAQDHGMSVSTARWHLKNIESKTETNRLDELASLIRSISAPIITK